MSSGKRYIFLRYHNLLLKKSKMPLNSLETKELKHCKKVIDDYIFQENFLLDIFLMACAMGDGTWMKEISTKLKELRGETV